MRHTKKQLVMYQLQQHKRHLPFMIKVAELVVLIAVFTGGQGFWSLVVGADPDITPPTAPSSLQVSARSTTEIDLSWGASTDDVGVDHYEIYRNGAAYASTVNITYNDSGLTPNTAYSYYITAFDAAGNQSAASNTVDSTTLADTSPPTAPSNLHQTGSTVSSVSFSWNASSDNVGVVAYNIYRSGSLIRSQSGTTYTDTGLSPFNAYQYNISAVDAANNASNLSSSLYAATAQDTTPPSVPDNVSETGSTVSSISLAWDASTDDVGVAGYHVYRDGSLIGSTGGTTFTDNGRTVSSSYTYTISAYDAAGNQSNQSAAFSGNSSNDTTPPTIPPNVHTTTIEDNSITIAWDAATDDVGVAGYKIYRNAVLVGTTTTDTSYTDSGLSPVTQYTYTVRAYDAANNESSDSAALQATTAYDTTPPSVPASLTSMATTDTTISLSWNASTDNVGVTGYDLYRNGALITTTSSTSYTDTGLAVHNSYVYSVRAHDGSGNNSAQTSPYTVSTLPDQVPPSTPGNVQSLAQTTTSISLSWDPASDDVGVVSYNIYRNGSLIANSTATNFDDQTLTYNTAYQYTVTALDAAGNESPASIVLHISTLPDTTPPVVAIAAPNDGQTAELTFPISATASDDLALARVEFYVDGALIQTIQAGNPFTFNWNRYAVHNGTHTLSVKAIDASGNYASQSINFTVTNPPPALLGDLNGDHKVNLLDLSILLSHWNKAGAGDFNNNGRVDIFDLSVLLGQYGKDNSNYQ
jgi:chitodextrinase